jgi:hypothetical protein
MAAPTKTSRRHSASPQLVNIFVSLIVFGALGYSLYQGWKAINPPILPTTALTGLTPVVATTPMPAEVKLLLNTDHERQGPDTVVNPGDFGRSNPFLTP